MSSRQITETPKRYQRGQTFRARQLNQLQQGIVRLNGGANPPLQLVGQATGANKIAIGRFVITEVAEDYLVCREFDGTPHGTVDDEIYAMRGINRGSGVFSDPNNTQKIEWLDLNLDARAWAAVEE